MVAAYDPVSKLYEILRKHCTLKQLDAIISDLMERKLDGMRGFWLLGISFFGLEKAFQQMSLLHPEATAIVGTLRL